MTTPPTHEDDIHHAKRNSISPSQRFLAGACSGIIEALCLTPLDVVKTRLQLNHQIGRSTNPQTMFATGRQLVHAEGFRGIYKGFTPWTTHVVLKNGSRFYFNAVFRRMLAEKDGTVTGTREFLAGAAAGATEAVLIVTPFEVVKTRLQGQDIQTGVVPRYTGPVQTTRVIVQTEGLVALWKGVAPTILRQGLNQACSFWTNTALKTYVWELEAGDTLPAWKSVVTGMVGAIPGPCLNCPMDVVKTRLMAQNHARHQVPKYHSTWHALVTIAREEGIRSLYRGLIPRLTRLCPSYGIQWLVMDQASAYFAQES